MCSPFQAMKILAAEFGYSVDVTPIEGTNSTICMHIWKVQCQRIELAMRFSGIWQIKSMFASWFDGSIITHLLSRDDWSCWSCTKIKRWLQLCSWNSICAEADNAPLLKLKLHHCCIRCSILLKGTVARDFLVSVFFVDPLYCICATDFEAERIFFSFSFSRSYSNFSMNPRSSLLRGIKISAVAYCAHCHSLQ